MLDYLKSSQVICFKNLSWIRRQKFQVDMDATLENNYNDREVVEAVEERKVNSTTKTFRRKKD